MGDVKVSLFQLKIMRVHILRKGTEILRAYTDVNLAKRVAVKLSKSDKNMLITPSKRPRFGIIPIKLK